jgi:glycine reductase
MRLELADFPVREIRLGKSFRYDKGALDVDRSAIVDLILRDQRVEEADVEVVHPGEKTRVTGIRDVVEPRWKVSGNGQVFPGTLTAMESVGSGRTNRMSGMGVFATAAFEGQARAGLAVQRSAILDFWGPGAQASRFSALAGLVLSMKLKPGLSDLDSHHAVQTAELKVGQRVAETTLGGTPANEEIVDLKLQRNDLPNVVFIQGCLADSQNFHSRLPY